jgi:membrane protease YdiL (CAAX protease family)
MTKKQTIAIITPLVLLPLMYGLFQWFSILFGREFGWYLGLAAYWIFWCVLFSIWLIGKDAIKGLIQPQKLTLQIFLIVMFPIVLTAIGRFVVGMSYAKASVWAFVGMALSAFCNGTFEEILWRGVYMTLFPNKILLRIVWPSLWFAAWHYAPGSISQNNQLLSLIIGAGCLGFYSSFVAKKTNTLWWSMIIHVGGGLLLAIS